MVLDQTKNNIIVTLVFSSIILSSISTIYAIYCLIKYCKKMIFIFHNKIVYKIFYKNNFYKNGIRSD